MPVNTSCKTRAALNQKHPLNTVEEKTRCLLILVCCFFVRVGCFFLIEVNMLLVMRLHPAPREIESRNHTRTERSRTPSAAGRARERERERLRHFDAAKRNSASAPNLRLPRGKSRQREAKGESIRGSETLPSPSTSGCQRNQCKPEWKEEIGPATEDPKERKESALR